MNTKKAVFVLCVSMVIAAFIAMAPAAGNVDALDESTLVSGKVDSKLIALASDKDVGEPPKITDMKIKKMVSDVGTAPTVDMIVITSEPYDLSGYMNVRATSEPRKGLKMYRTLGSLKVDDKLMNRLLKIASIKEVVAVNSLQPLDVPEPPDPDLVDKSKYEDAVKNRKYPAKPPSHEPNMWLAASGHGARRAWENGFTGSGTKVAVIDSGVDFAHPDLQGTQARVEDVTSPYYGWPIAFDPHSMFYYLLYGGAAFPEIRSWYSDTSSTDEDVSPADGVLDNYGYNVSGIVSQSGTYHVGVHPDENLNHTWYGEYVAVLVADCATAGIYDTVYVDLDNDRDFTDEKACVKGDELSWHDNWNSTAGVPGSDGYADISGGMVYFIADGANPIPYSDVLAYWWGLSLTIPLSGDLVAFMGSLDYLQGHGTRCASAVAAQARSGESTWDARDGFVQGMAPDTKIIAVGNFYTAQIMDNFYFAAEGYDGVPGTGDEAQIVSCSFGASGVINDGWDYESRFIDWITTTYNPDATFTISSGNSGFGYGTASSPLSPGVVSVGASTSYWDFEPVNNSSQYNWGDVQPWSSRGPNAIGQVDPDVVTVGAWAAGDLPLNQWSDGYTAWARWGGTSLSAPATAGELALVYDAFFQKNGAFPSSELARNILMSGADNINYDVLQQGAGITNADRATLLANDMNGLMVRPAFWTVGDYRDTKYDAFSRIISPGESDILTLTVENHNLSNPVTANVSDSVLRRTGVWTTVIDTNGSLEDGYQFTEPDYLINITGEIPSGTDLLKATYYINFSAFDPDGDYEYDEYYRFLIYKWTDLDSDGVYWNDLNGDGVVQAGEVDQDSGYELNRFTYGYNYADISEVFLHDPESRGADGILLGLQHHTGTGSAMVCIQLEFYENADWTWITERTNTLILPAGGTDTFDATMNIPADAGIGLYEGKILINDGTDETVIPVIVNVAANSTRFGFGGNTLTTDLYDNNKVFGGFNWEGGYDAGDWRFYFTDIPDDTPIDPGTKLTIDVSWENVPTDIDVYVLGPTSDPFTPHPRYGPYTLGSYGGSDSGKFLFDTTTGVAEEMISADLSTGLHEILLHNVLYAGRSFSENISGRVATISIDPPEMDKVTFAGIKDTRTFNFTSGIELTGLSVQAYGLSQPQNYMNKTILQDNPHDPMTASWVHEYDVSDAGLIEVSTTSLNSGLDIDLFLIYDSNNDNIPDSNERIAASTAPYADEHVSVILPDDGRYWVFVHGWSVPEGSSTFDCVVDIIAGTDLTVNGVPTGTILADRPYNFTVAYTAPEVGDYDGILFIGPTKAPAALTVPVTIISTAGVETNIVTIKDVTLRPGDTEDVPIRLLNSTGVCGGVVTLTFNQSIVNVTNVVAGDFEGVFNTDYSDVSNGILRIACMKFGQDLTDDLVLATITLDAVGTNGSCELGLYAELTDKSGITVDSSVNNGTFTISTRIPGDVTGDGNVNINDAVLLFNWVSFPNERETTYVLNKPENANVNGDTETNVNDAVLLFNWVLFPNERGTTYILQ
jgi:subtilisin family serine protease